jgi:hypothetical protein
MKLRGPPRRARNLDGQERRCLMPCAFGEIVDTQAEDIADTEHFGMYSGARRSR